MAFENCWHEQSPQEAWFVSNKRPFSPAKTVAKLFQQSFFDVFSTVRQFLHALRIVMTMTNLPVTMKD